MYRAIYNNKLIDADEAILEYGKEKDYYCPYCNSKVTLCSGHIKLPYFSHMKNSYCNEEFYDPDYDNEWHLYIQSLFPKECREVRISLPIKLLFPEDFDENDLDGDELVTHIADVCIGDYVVEIQHSPMDPDIFYDRTNLYQKAGYKVIWIFDWREKFYKDHIECYDDIIDRNDQISFKWAIKYPPKTCMWYLPQRYLDNLAIYFCIYDDDEFFIHRIIWAIPTEDDEADYKRVVTRQTLGGTINELAEHLIFKYKKVN